MHSICYQTLWDDLMIWIFNVLNYISWCFHVKPNWFTIWNSTYLCSFLCRYCILFTIFWYKIFSFNKGFHIFSGKQLKFHINSPVINFMIFQISFFLKIGTYYHDAFQTISWFIFDSSVDPRESSYRGSRFQFSSTSFYFSS